MSISTTPTITRYRAATTGGMVQAVDFSQVAGEHYAFFELRNDAGVAPLQALLAAAPLKQEAVALTHVHGRPLLITRGTTDAPTLLQALKQRGERFEPVREKPVFDAWKIRSYLGFAGQTLQLGSSFLRPKLNLDSSMFVFAASNLAANAVNLVYHQGQEVEDVHQLRYLKKRINRELSPHLKSGESVIAIDSSRLAQRPAEEAATPLSTARSFLRHHLVAIGELGLRYFGAVGLAFPARYWKAAWQSKSLPQFDSSPYRVYAGLSSISGKTVALSSRIPDPYNPTPPSWLDTVREKCSFILGGLIEITSFSALAYGCFFKTSGNGYAQGVKLGKKLYPDFIGGIGASLFVMGYIVRTWAKFGHRTVNMPELYAHASDMLAETPPEKIPALLANTAASLTEHFDVQKPVAFSQIYSGLVADLKKYHAVALQPSPAVKPPVASKADAPSTTVSSVTREEAALPAARAAGR